MRWMWTLLVVSAAACDNDGSNQPADAAESDAPNDAPNAPNDPTLTVTLVGAGIGTVSSNPAGILCGTECAAPFPANTMVILTAEPADGSVFASWGGACSGTSPTCTVTVDAAKSASATFDVAKHSVALTKSGAGTGTVSGGAIACGTTCTTMVDHGTMITLSATPASLSVFAGWGGACSGTGACSVTVTSDTAITAAFALNDLTLTVARGGNGSGTVTSAPAGIACPIDCDQTYTAGTNVTLTAAPSVGSTFTGWSGGGCSGTGTCMVSVNTATVVTATFTLKTYMLSVLRPGTGTGTVTSTPAGIACGPDCIENYSHGQMVTLTAAPTTGSVFAGWSGACSGLSTCSVTMTGVSNVQATFTLNTYTLNVMTTGNGTGVMSASGINCPGDCTEVYGHGTVVMMSAVANPGSTFTNWGGACAGYSTATQCNVYMTQARSALAEFTTP